MHSTRVSRARVTAKVPQPTFVPGSVRTYTRTNVPGSRPAGAHDLVLRSLSVAQFGVKFSTRAALRDSRTVHGGPQTTFPTPMSIPQRSKRVHGGPQTIFPTSMRIPQRSKRAVCDAAETHWAWGSLMARALLLGRDRLLRAKDHRVALRNKLRGQANSMQ